MPDKNICVSVAALQHLFWMTTFLSSGAYAVNLVKLFKNTNDFTLVDSQTFWPIPVVTWIFAGFTVGICLALHFLGFPVYGLSHKDTCWFSSAEFFLWSFVVPISSILLLNICSFIIAITFFIKIRSAANNNSTLAYANNLTSNLTMCCKIILVLGLSWIIAFLDNVPSLPYIDYVSAIVNSLQGFFLAIAFAGKPHTSNKFQSSIRTATTRYRE